MKLNNRNLNLFLAALTTAILFISLSDAIPVPFALITSLTDSFGYIFGLLFMVGIQIITKLVLAIPGAAWLRYRHVPHYIALSVFAVLQAYCLSYPLVPVLAPISWWVWAAASAVLLILAYFLADLLFNRWTIRFRYKLAVAVAAVILAAVAGDGIIRAMVGV